MSDRSETSFVWLMVFLAILSLFAYVKLNESEIRDLQRRIATSESSHPHQNQ